jgi:hypothetical protein
VHATTVSWTGDGTWRCLRACALTIKSPLRLAARAHDREQLFAQAESVTNYPIVDRGQGPYLFDTDGRRYSTGRAAR